MLGIESGTERKKPINGAYFHHLTCHHRVAVSKKKFALEPGTLTLMPILLMHSCKEWVLFQVFLHPTRIVPLLSQEPSGPGLGKARSICSSLPCQGYPGVRPLGQALFTYSSSQRI